VSKFLLWLVRTEEDAMAVDLILRARERRERLVAELARIDAFLAMASELENEWSEQPKGSRRVGIGARDGTKRGGLGADTVAAALQILRDHGHPLPTRDLVPLVIARGIEIGGKSQVATLSARLNAAKGITLDLISGKWCLINTEEVRSASGSEKDESADPSLAGKSADSLFHHQAKEDRYAATLD
jgi:hypothetical protein